MAKGVGPSPFFGTKSQVKSIKINLFRKLQAAKSPKTQPTSLIGGQICVFA
jgi:hypothetical protein